MIGQLPRQKLVITLHKKEGITVKKGDFFHKTIENVSIRNRGLFFYKGTVNLRVRNRGIPFHKIREYLCSAENARGMTLQRIFIR